MHNLIHQLAHQAGITTSQARTFLKCLQSPNEAMITAGAQRIETMEMDVMSRNMSENPDMLPDWDAGDFAKHAFKAMIDIALEPEN